MEWKDFWRDEPLDQEAIDAGTGYFWQTSMPFEAALQGTEIWGREVAYHLDKRPGVTSGGEFELDIADLRTSPGCKPSRLPFSNDDPSIKVTCPSAEWREWERHRPALTGEPSFPSDMASSCFNLWQQGKQTGETSLIGHGSRETLFEVFLLWRGRD
ncbi:uncharacterized protein MCYG_07298 [Microsporum canis CBS 113480]|uniref:Uncharacterized protein n=1 Tax=Arthroderma otae (strain ATCC MYA-4605 / CBS 113480) TaxID=554155 RepID=C5FY81_ARTOC|nr:uncharacterized protein MCYG_07298 [Microsporum canis CBS 113480]EEQ34479.1 predicted protein [Microsporum canis CBS 113480]